MSALKRLIDRLIEQDHALQQLAALTRDSEEKAAYLNAVVDLAKVGVRPEQITVMARLLARGDINVEGTPHV